MKHRQDTVLREGTGLAVQGASVTVYLANTTTKATLYATDGGAVKPNPLTTDAHGRYDYWVPTGIYDEVATKGSYTSTNEDVDLRDPDNTLSDGDLGDIIISGLGTAVNIDPNVLSAFGRLLASCANAAAARAQLALGTAAQANTGDFAAAAHNHDAAYQAKATLLTALAGLGLVGKNDFLVAINATADGFVTVKQKFWVGIAADGTGAPQVIGLGEAVNQDQCFVYVNGVLKLPITDYTVAGTNLTITAAAGAKIYVRYLGVTAVAGPPVNTAAPVVTGTATEGQLLTVNPGAWTNAPNAPTYQWYRNDAADTTTPTAIAGEVGTTYLLAAADVGLYVYCVETVTNASGAASKESNFKGAIAAAGGGLTAPVLTLTSGAGAVPEWTIATMAEYMGLTLQVQQTATAGNYTSPAQDIGHMILPSDIAAGAITNVDLVADGWADPSGNYGIRARIVRDDGTTSAWSNEITGTVSVSVATWSPTTGNDKSQYLTASGGNLTLTMNNAVGANCGCRATISASGKRYFETTVVSHGTEGAGSIALGVTDDTTALGAGVFPKPGGASGGGGGHWRLKNGSTIVTVNRNGAEVAGTSLTTAVADGDKFGINFDTVANTVTLFHKPFGGAWYQVQQITLTSQIPANWRAYAAGFGRTGGGAPYDAFTTNFGGSAFDRALDTGYSMYG